MFRSIVASAIVLAGIGGGIAATSSGQAHASGTTISKISETKSIVSAKCYNDVRTTTTYYHHSAKTGWIAYPSPKVTVTKSEHCYK